jgi:hypothetical protein
LIKKDSLNNFIKNKIKEESISVVKKDQTKTIIVRNFSENEDKNYFIKTFNQFISIDIPKVLEYVSFEIISFEDHVSIQMMYNKKSQYIVDIIFESYALSSIENDIFCMGLIYEK